jgi:ABC-type cobalamin/Fe3+-siderophores transport system ATPase subunit
MLVFKHLTTTQPEEASPMSYSIPIVLMNNSYGVLDVILTGDGRHSRRFRDITEVLSALEAIGVSRNDARRVMDELHCGHSTEISVTPDQYTSFYSLYQ